MENPTQSEQTQVGNSVAGTYAVATAQQTQAVGRLLAGCLKAGDVVILSGALGAGKTTFAQGLGEGLQVRGPITSPTYIVARVHPSLVGGVDLIHADAYRISSLEDFETLDLDSTVSQAVTVVEWGAGKTEALSPSWVEVEITRQLGGDLNNFITEVAANRDVDNTEVAANRTKYPTIDLGDICAGERQITIRVFGPRWEAQDG